MEVGLFKQCFSSYLSFQFFNVSRLHYLITQWKELQNENIFFVKETVVDIGDGGQGPIQESSADIDNKKGEVVPCPEGNCNINQIGRYVPGTFFSNPNLVANKLRCNFYLINNLVKDWQ